MTVSQSQIPYLPKPPLHPADWLVEHAPVNAHATAEAQALLRFLYRLSNHHTLTGQHNFPAQQEYCTRLATASLGKTPALYGTDWGFAAHGDKDSAYVRRETVQHLIKQWHAGSVITLCWHAVAPVQNEPVTFQGGVQSRLNAAQFTQLLTPGSPIYNHWAQQVDVIAAYLRQLQDARVPVLWRPCHEINGAWFWWNGHRNPPAGGSLQLYRNLYDRLVNRHGLHHLLWVWNPDQPTGPDRQFVDYFPGQDVVDVLALDCYGEFRQSFYDDLNALSHGKVMAIGETRHPPSLETYRTQPKWCYFMRWAVDMPAAGRPAETLANLQEMAADQRMFSRDDWGYIQAMNAVRQECGLSPLTKTNE